MIRLFLPILVLLLASSITYAQRIKKPITAVVGWSHAGQQSDYLMGLDMGVLDESKRFQYFLSFDVRPYRRKVQEFIGNNTFYQYQEERYMILIGARYFYQFQNSGKGVFLGASSGYNWGNYRGLNRGPDNGWIVRPNVGLFWDLAPEVFTLQLGYEYFDSRSDAIKDHWVFLTFLIKFNTNEM